MAWDGREFQRRLAQAVDAYDRREVNELIEQLVAFLAQSDDRYPSEDAERIMTLLRRKRFFDELAGVGDAFLRAGNDSPAARRHYAQALIEQGNLTVAQTVLKSIVADTSEGERENREARGLLGRAYKQQYMDAGVSNSERSRDWLREAAKWYYSVYQGDPTQLWHGINTVAVSARAAADGVTMSGVPDPEVLARDIFEAVETRRIDQEATMWDYAIGLEACVALGRNEDALEWAKRYVSSPNSDAFEVTSTLRQMEEVWRLSPDDEPGSWLIPLLRASVLGHEGGVLELDAGTAHLESLSEGIEGGRLEAVLGDEYFENVRWLRNALDRSASVARIADASGRAKGTGFVVAAGDLGLDEGDPEELLLITNAHVISKDPAAGAVPWEEAEITFEDDDTRTGYRVEVILWSSPEQDLDATVLRTQPPLEDRPAVPVANVIPVPGARVYVIGHPQGRALSWSIYDNKLLKRGERYLHYRTPTEQGSSGSPVFNRDWKLIGLHHYGNRMIELEGGDEPQPANEGIAILALQARAGKPSN
jgi:hypothetical protein